MLDDALEKEKAWFLAHSDDEKKKKRIAQQKAREAEQAKKEAKRKKKEVRRIVFLSFLCFADRSGTGEQRQRRQDYYGEEGP